LKHLGWHEALRIGSEKWYDAAGVKKKRKRKRYEYRCPRCGYINVRYEETKRIVCFMCGFEFYTW